MPAEYIRKQTIANGERYITPALKEMEGKILGAEERSTRLEYEIFQRLREEVLGLLESHLAGAGDDRARGELRDAVKLLRELGTDHDLGEQYRYALLKG